MMSPRPQAEGTLPALAQGFVSSPICTPLPLGLPGPALWTPSGLPDTPNFQDSPGALLPSGLGVLAASEPTLTWSVCRMLARNLRSPLVTSGVRC